MPDRFGIAWMLVCVALTVSVATFSVSAYTNDTRDRGDPLYGITASGLHTSPGTLACGPSYEFGTLFHVKGYGWAVCIDRGGAITDGNLDVWMEREADALRWGRRELSVEYTR